jgi:alpha-glucosidase
MIQKTQAKLQILSNKAVRFIFDPGTEQASRNYHTITLPKNSLKNFFTKNGSIHSIERNEFQFFFNEKSLQFSFRQGKHKAFSNQKSITGTLHPGKGYLLINLWPESHVFGFGARPGKFMHNGKIFSLLNKDTVFYSDRSGSYSSFPFFIIRKNNNFSGIFFNIALPAKVTVDHYGQRLKKPAIQFEIEKDSQNIVFDICIMWGKLFEILEAYTGITGRPFLPPLWSLGYHQSKWSYHNQQSMVEIGKKFRELDFPVDALHLDIHYMDKYRIFTWDRKNFPDPESMNRELESLGIKTVAIVDPGVSINQEYEIYNDAIRNNIFCKSSSGSDFIGNSWPGKVSFPDFTRKRVRQWWAERHRELLAKGVSGIWNDLNDPLLNLNPLHDPAKLDVFHKNGRHWSFRNLYANLEAEATDQAFRIFQPNQRGFILSRSGFSGIQKHAALWTGDNFASWDQLKENLHMVMNLGLSGVPFCGADIGGFGGARGLLGFLKLRKNKELFLRWFQLGSLMPFFRAHTTLAAPRNEPWHFGESMMKVLKKHAQRRYALLPYIYSLFYRSSKNGAPLVRPLFYHYKNVPDIYLNKQFMLGPSILAAPVLIKNLKENEIFLPKGTWYEYEKGKRFQGNATYRIKTPPDYYPLFVKGGSILPKVLPGKNALDSFNNFSLILEIYPAQKMFGMVYLDDGITKSHQRGIFSIIKFSGKMELNGCLKIVWKLNKKNFSPEYQLLTLKIPKPFAYLRLNNEIYKGVVQKQYLEKRKIKFTEFDLPFNKIFKEQKLEFYFFTKRNKIH